MNNKLLKSLAGMAFCSVLLSGCGNNGTSTTTTTTTSGQTTTTEFLVYPNSTADQVEVAQVFLGPGSLQLISTGGAPTGDDPVFVKTAPNNQWVYEANNQNATVFGYQINSAGVLGSLPNGPYNTIAGVASLDINPAGAFLFAAGTSQVQTLGINSDGSLTALFNTTLALPAAPSAMAFTSNTGGTYLNVATGNGANAGISTFLVNNSSGQLTAVANVSTPGLTFSGLAANSSGTVLYAALQTSSTTGQVVPYTVGSSGALTAGSTVTLDGAPGELVLTTAGNLYVGTSAATIDGYVANSNGVLTTLPNSPYASGSVLSFLSLDPSQTLIYGSATAANSIYGFQIGSDGSLTSAANNPYQSSVASPGHVDFSQFSITN